MHHEEALSQVGGVVVFSVNHCYSLNQGARACADGKLKMK